MTNKNLPTNRVATIELVGWREPKRGQFAKLTKKAIEEQQALLKEIESPLRKIAEEVSPVGVHPFGTPEGWTPFAKSWKFDRHETLTGGDLDITNTSDHAGFVIFPTRAHPIAAKKAEYLRFMSRDNEVVFTKRVMHPGTKGNDVPSKILKRAGDDFRKQLSASSARVAKHFRNVFN